MRTRFTLFIFILLLSVSCFLLAGEKATKQEAIPNAYIVIVKDGYDVNEVADALALKVKGSVQHRYFKAVRGFSIVVPAGMRKSALKNDFRVAYIEPDYKVTLPPDEFAATPAPARSVGTAAQTIPPGMIRIGLDPDSLNLAAISNIGIAILDTGIDLDHPDLNVVGGESFVSGGLDDRNGHGSHVAGTTAAIHNDFGVVGVAPGARLYAVRVLNAGGSGSTSGIIAGIDWVTSNADIISVANMSIGGTGKSNAYREAIQNSVAAGIFYAVAAGNESRDVYGDNGIYESNIDLLPSDDVIPAAYPEAATVSAIYDVDDTFASFSNYNANYGAEVFVQSTGGAIDLAAPGVYVLSTYKRGDYATMSGTSMASPHVAGAAALYISIYGRDINSDGFINATDIELIRQALIDMGLLQADWNSVDTLDPDSNPEAMLNVRNF